jgi:hypothetical protein
MKPLECLVVASFARSAALHPSNSGGHELASFDAGLQAVTAAWAAMPRAIQTVIIALAFS